jgi:hypothetical protein
MMDNVQKKSCFIPDIVYGLTLPKILHLKILSHSFSNKILGLHTIQYLSSNNGKGEFNDDIECGIGYVKIFDHSLSAQTYATPNMSFSHKMVTSPEVLSIKISQNDQNIARSVRWA